MDDYRIDSHKLIYHIEHLYRWLKGEDICPIYIEISLSRGCNQRCIFCALDYLEYKPIFLDKDTLKRFLRSIANKGVKSVMYAGEGEPLLHKDIFEFISYARDKGLDIAITSNGVLLDKKMANIILSKLSWLRISLNAGTPKTYSLIHQTNQNYFGIVMNNIRQAVIIKKEKGYSCTIGVQSLLLNQNYNEMERLTEILKKIGLDYFVIKPYSQHPKSFNRLNVNYDSFLNLEEKLSKYSDNRFKVIFRKQAMKKSKEEKPYKRCLGFSFWSYLDSKGNLYACSTFLGNERFCYGNIYEEDFKKIWKGKRRKRIMRMMAKSWDTKNCRDICRLDEINRYLWELENPPLHVNFV